MSTGYTISERSDGRFFARINIGRDKNGRIKYKSIYGYTKKEVKEKVRAFTTDLDNYGKPLDNTSITLTEWAYKHLFTNVHSRVASSTFERYMSIYNNHIKDTPIGDMKIKDIQQMHLQHYMNEKKSLSKSSMKKIYELLDNVFRFAISNNIIRINPILEVKLPSSEVKVKDIEILTLQEQKAYIQALEGIKLQMLYLILLYTGMRVGEAMALKWDNVNLNETYINVCENFRKVKQYEVDGKSTNTAITKAPKTEKGNRLIPIPQFLVLELKKYKLSSNKSKEGLVFCSRNGTPLEYNTIRRSHITVCKRAKIRPYECKDKDGKLFTKYKGVSLHALRHTFATRAIENSIDVKTVSELLGHASIEITLNTYVHSTTDTKRAAADTMEKMYKELLR